MIFQDKKGKDHIITKEIQKEWIDTFGLKNLDDTYIPKFNNEIKKVLGDKKLKLQKGSLLKLVSQGRQKFIPEIKKVLDDPEIIITDKNGEFILAKHLKDKDYFVNVSFDNGEYLISISNGIKEINNLNNKIKQGGRILYQSPNANFISQTLLQTSQYSANKMDNKTIPNQSIKEAENLTLLSRKIPDGNPKTSNLDNLTNILKGEEPPRPRTSSPYNVNDKTIPSQDLKSADMENSDNLFKKIRDASKKILSTFLGKTSKNNIDGREVKFTKRSLDKMTSGSAVGKSLDNGFTREEHYEAAQNILEIFKTAKFVETQPPKNGSLDILGVHKYMGEYKNANVKITIKEIKEHGNTFYSIELMELLSRDMQSGDPKTGNLDNTAIIHTDEEPPRPRTSSPYNANSRTIPNQSIKEAENLTQYRKDIEAKYNIRPIKEFGTNYAEFYHDGANAIKKLLTERQGQVAGAFERKELGDIDLVWGEVTDAIKHKGYGLSHILDKRMAQFMEQGLSKEQAQAKAIELINKLPDIIKNGQIEQNGGRFRIQKDNYVIGLTSEYKGEKRNWIITAFEKGNPQSFTEADFTAKSDNLLSNPS